MEQTNSSYNDFISYINENMVKVQELLEKVLLMQNETLKILLETCTLLNPQLIIELNEIEINGRKFDEFILAGQELKSKLLNLTANPHKSVEEYRQIMDELNLIDSQLETLEQK